MKAADVTTPEREEVVKKITSNGHWRVLFYPPQPPKPVITLSRAKELLTSSAVDLTGWDYPHIPTIDNNHQRRLYSVGTEFVEGVTDFQKYKEILRFYRSALFYHLVAFWEDWLAEESWLPSEHRLRKLPPGVALDFLSVNLKVSEMFLFLKNLAASDIYTDGVVFRLELRGMKDRALVSLDPGRMPLRDSYRCETDVLKIGPRLISPGEVQERALDVAAEVVLEIYHAFNWDSVSLDRINEEQQGLLKRHG